MTAEPIAVARPPTGRVPLWLKLAYTLFLCVLIPVYWVQYTPLNFLWFCDVALLLTLLALWSERPRLASMPTVAIVLPQLLWVADFVVGLVTGAPVIGLAAYMFNPEISLFTRGLSLFHGWLPFLLLWLVWRLGYDRRALAAQTLLAWGVLAVSYLLVSDPASPAGNVNKILGPQDDAVQTMMLPWMWLGMLLAVYPVCVYLPTHVILRRYFPGSA